MKLSKDQADKLYQEAILKYGPEAQMKIVIGEIGEFLTLVGREEQGRASKQDWIDEIADLKIMMDQTCLIKGISEAEIQQVTNDKHQRLAMRLVKDFE